MLYEKDFETIADIISAAKLDSHAIGGLTGTTYTLAMVRRLAGRLADYLATKNPKFDREKFLSNCEFYS